MDSSQYQKTYFKTCFDKTVKEQSQIKQELIGQSFSGVFYTPKVEGWNINIKDKTVIHLPYGYLTFTTISGENYRINTNYQTWHGGVFGILLEKIVVNETHHPLVDLTNYILDKGWNDIKNSKVADIKWNWKREPACKFNGQKFTISEVQKYLFEDGFVPESFEFHFDNEKKIYFFALEPDEEFTDKNTYHLLSGGEEIMIFFDETKLKNWDINKIGFQIQVD